MHAFVCVCSKTDLMDPFLNNLTSPLVRLYLYPNALFSFLFLCLLSLMYIADMYIPHFYLLFTICLATSLMPVSQNVKACKLFVNKGFGLIEV